MPGTRPIFSPVLYPPTPPIGSTLTPYSPAPPLRRAVSQIDRLSSVRIYLQKDLRPLDTRKAGVSGLAEALVRLAAAGGKAGGGRVPLLDPEDDMKARSVGGRGEKGGMGASGVCVWRERGVLRTLCAVGAPVCAFGVSGVYCAPCALLVHLSSGRTRMRSHCCP